MSRMTDLIARAKIKDNALGEALENEYKALTSRRAFGLNFERHKPERVELPGRPIRKGDKVRILAPRRSGKKGNLGLWRVLKINKAGKTHIAELTELDAENPDIQNIPVDDLIVIAEFRDYIYPGLISTGKIERGHSKPYHTVINGENFHALEALTYTHRGQIDLIYIDPPYNSGSKDWKYNNNYVAKDDLFRHSKWLAFIERRLLVAKELLNPLDSALICTIDEKEYLNLGLLLKQTFPEARIQMVSSVINAKGIIRENEFSRTNEFIFFVFFGQHKINPEEREVANNKVRWASLRRSDVESARGTQKGGPEQFYPIYVNRVTGSIEEIGPPLKADDDVHQVPERDGCITVLPIRDKGQVKEMNWGLTVPTLKKRLSSGYVKAVFSGKKKEKVTIYYLTSGLINDIEEGLINVKGYEESGAAIVSYVDGKKSNPKTQWDRESHNAQTYGSDLIRSLLPGREFPFPKSLYAVEDALKISIGGKPDAKILDFFSGSGTTAHAVMRINRQDKGRRQSISVTNNEVSASESAEFIQKGLRPGDEDWEANGICEYITKPRIKAVILGRTPEGKEVKGSYKFTDESPISNGFEENVEFFNLTYETPIAVRHNIAFERIAPLLWLRAGAQGKRIELIPERGWDIAETYGILIDLDQAVDFCTVICNNDRIQIAYIVTDDDRRFQSVTRHLPDSVEPVRLYESYLSNFRFSMGR